MSPAEDNLRDQSAERFLCLVQQKRRGRLKVYFGLAAGVGKTCRLLQKTIVALALPASTTSVSSSTSPRFPTRPATAAAPAWAGASPANSAPPKVAACGWKANRAPAVRSASRCQLLDRQPA